ncbi:hypothetical protein HJB72_01760 [Rhizobium lentis]|uniref:hypothetical protein n=1 Tax=Rhizobium lentis TaxID=1138194 RepID=UPI001C82A09D|nr:hypothetical protein [Rhizobium lentis]MBX4996717.1 hypothetical protein [Rhizobium lentis]
MKMRVVAAVALAAIAGCQSAPRYTPYKAGTVQSDRQLAFDQCKIASLQEIPQSMAISTSPGYYNPGTLSCSTIGNYTSCNRVGEVNIPASTSTYDQNGGLRERYLMRCMASKGYTMLEKLPLCSSEKERQAALYQPQPASPAQMKCTAGVALDQ